MRQFHRFPLPVLLALAVAACGGPAKRPAPLPPALATPVVAAPLIIAPAAAPRAVDLPRQTMELMDIPGADAALAAFRKSCASLQKREDRSGLTQAGDWSAACTAAAKTTDAAAFFRLHFTALAIGAEAGKGFTTGYFEPEIAGSRVSAAGFPAPFYRRPADLIEADLGEFAADLKGRKLRGRIAGQRLVPYFDRAAIAAGALVGRGLELAWAADPFEAFFLEIQGSGRLRLPDGSIMRIGYDSQNGHGYVAIGRVLIDRGLLPKGGANMDAILGWLRANPAEAPGILAANPSQVFFREIIGEGPVGAMGIAVTPGVSVAADPLFMPLGAPLLVETSITASGAPLAAMMVAQDTGGAIKGANRIDLFRGAGQTARTEAGAQSAPARILILIPRAAAARLLP